MKKIQSLATTSKQSSIHNMGQKTKRLQEKWWGKRDKGRTLLKETGEAELAAAAASTGFVVPAAAGTEHMCRLRFLSSPSSHQPSIIALYLLQIRIQSQLRLLARETSIPQW